MAFLTPFFFFFLKMKKKKSKVPTLPSSTASVHFPFRVIKSFNVNGAPPLCPSLPALRKNLVLRAPECGSQGERRSLSDSFRLLTSCEGPPPQDPGPKVPQPPMHSSIDAPLFSINVFTVITHRLGGFLTGRVSKHAVGHICEINFLQGYVPEVGGIGVQSRSDITGLT